jgi:hypothetical protein
MKPLVIVACLSVIAMSVYVVGGGLLSETTRANEAKETAMLERCDALIATPLETLAALTGAEKAAAEKLRQDCIKFIRGD